MIWMENKPTATVPAIAPVMPISSPKPFPPRWTAVAESIWLHSQLTAWSAALPKLSAIEWKASPATDLATLLAQLP